MRTVLLGTDFVYNKDGNLVPLEINTNTGWQTTTVEDEADKLDLSSLTAFVNTRNFTKIVYIGSMTELEGELKTFSESLGLQFEVYSTNPTSLTVPYIEDDEQTLIIRSAYDATAIVDDTYCSNKVNFLNLIKNESFGSQFAYLDGQGALANNITTISNNGGHPNFILKAVEPAYDKEVYPKLYRVSTQEELDVVLQNVTSDYFLMEFHFNPSKLYEANGENLMQIYRSFNLLYPPTLESIPLASYTSLTGQRLSESNVYDAETFELESSFRYQYISTDENLILPKLLDTDKVELADGTFKTALDLETGDLLRTIDIPNPNNVDLANETADFGIDYDTFVAETTYSVNRVISKVRVDRLVNYVRMDFTDGTFWEDTAGSSYLINENNNVRFAILPDRETPGDEFSSVISIGDKIILIDTTNNLLTFVEKEVASFTVTKTVFGGWTIAVEREHLFLTQTTGNTSFAAIEHNVTCKTSSQVLCQTQGCPKGQFCTKNLQTPCQFLNTCNCKNICITPK
jgi:hypothetical protein